jgi:hypothetical protein
MDSIEKDELADFFRVPKFGIQSFVVAPKIVPAAAAQP